MSRPLRTSPPNQLNRLWLAVSGHGHGHLVQVTPLIRALRDRDPALVVAVQSELPEELLRQTIGDPLELHAESSDVGMVMAGPMTVLADESLAAYQQFHATWDQRVARQVAMYERFIPDLVISDVSYLPLAAATQCGIPAVAVCSLNWADILEHYCAGKEPARGIVDSIRAHYAAADRFLRPAPSMPMAALGNTVAIGPLVTVRASQRERLLANLQLPQDRRIVLVTLGGIAGEVDISRWSDRDNAGDGTIYLVPASWLNNSEKEQQAQQFRSIESTGLSFAELFASCDALVTKPGYGAFAGAGCAGLPVLYVERGDWPEEPYLTAWLSQVGRATAIDANKLARGDFAKELDTLTAQPPKPPAVASGAAEGVTAIDALLKNKASSTQC